MAIGYATKRAIAAKKLHDAHIYLLGSRGWRDCERACDILAEAERFVRNGFSTKLTPEFFASHGDPHLYQNEEK